MKYLTPIPLKDKYWRYIEAQVNRVFFEEFYKPLFAIIRPTKKQLETQIKNAGFKYGSPLADAVADDRVWFEDGEFKGQFNSQISKTLRNMGARYNQRSKTWSYSGLLPAEVSTAIAVAAGRYTALRQTLLSTLGDLNIGSINRLNDFDNKYQQTIDWMEGDFQKAVKGVTVPPTLTLAQRNMIAANWGTNLDLYVKDWLAKNILELRGDIMKQVFAGKRAESMVKGIVHNYQVSQRKAEFLARQETSLLMSKFHETRYTDMGAPKYKWSGAMDARERPDHRALEGKIFDWKNPPITDKRTGARNNPGEDYNCRCLAIPILETPPHAHR